MFNKICKSRAVNVVFAVFIAVLLAVPFIALPEAGATIDEPRLETSKWVWPEEIWLKGLGTPDIATVTLDLEALGVPQATRVPIDVVLIIDRSGSMWGTPLTDAKTAAKAFVDQLQATDRAGMVSFSSGTTLDKALADMIPANKTALKTAIDGLVATDMTAIGDGMHMANEHLIANARPGAAHVAILLTDGYHNWGTWHPVNLPLDAAQEAVDNGIVYYTIGLGSVDTAMLTQVATDTGGAYYYAPTSSDLAAVYSAIADSISYLAGAGIVVTEVLPNYLNYEGNASIAPDAGFPVVNPDGTTTIQWTVGLMSIGDYWEVSFDVSSNKPGTADVDKIPGAKVTYTDYTGATVPKDFPQEQLFVKAPMMAEVNVGPAYFAGQTVEVYVMTTVGGRLVPDVTIDEITIWYGANESLTIPTSEVTEVSDGLHKFTYKLLDDAAGGGYKIVVESSYFGISVASSGIFQVITIPLPWVLPIWVWALILVGAIFILMVIAVRIAR